MARRDRLIPEETDTPERDNKELKTMRNFSFKGRKRGGEEVKGTRAADSTSALALALRSEDIMLVEAKEKEGLQAQ